MKEYEVAMKQELTGIIVIKADTKTEAKELVNELIDNDKMQHLIQDVEELSCGNWEVKAVEDY